jgi:hypothetical protein
MTGSVVILLFVACLVLAARLLLKPDVRPPIPADHSDRSRPSRNGIMRNRTKR